MVEGSGVRTPMPKLSFNKKIKISNKEFDGQTERRFVFLWPTKVQSKSLQLQLRLSVFLIVRHRSRAHRVIARGNVGDSRNVMVPSRFQLLSPYDWID